MSNSKTKTEGNTHETIGSLRAALRRRRTDTVIVDGHALDAMIEVLRDVVHRVEYEGCEACEPCEACEARKDRDIDDLMASVGDIADALTVMRFAGPSIPDECAAIDDEAEATSQEGDRFESLLASLRERRCRFMMVDGHRLDELIDDLRFASMSLCLCDTTHMCGMAMLLDSADQLTVLRHVGAPLCDECEAARAHTADAVPAQNPAPE